MMKLKEGIHFSSDRQVQLFKILYDSKEPLTREFLSEKLNVSTRTILSEIKEVNYIISSYDVLVVNIRGQGYKIKFSDDINTEETYERIMNECIYYDIPVDSEDRVKFIIRNLLEGDKYSTVQNFSDILYVSKQTISNDLKLVRSILEKFELTLKIKASHGINIEGIETKKRKCYSYCLPFRSAEENVYAVGDREEEFFKDLDIKKLYEIVEDNINQYGHNTIDIINKVLTVHIAISIKRILSKIEIEDQACDLYKDYIEESNITSKIIENVEREFNIVFSKNEFNYILIYVICCTKDSKNNNESNQENSMKLVEELFQYIWENYQYDFRSNEKLAKDLEVHMRSLVKRIKYAMKIKNTVLEEIKQKYPMYFEMSLMGLRRILSNNIEALNEDEAGFVALHLAAAEQNKIEKTVKKRVIIVCGSGIGSGRLIEAKIRSKLSEHILIEKVMAYSEYKKNSTLDCDLVITTIPLEKKNVPIIKINSIPDDEEVMDIVNKMDKDIENEIEILSKFFKEEIFFSQVDIKSKDEAIKFLCGNLLKENFVKPEFEASVMEREKIANTVITTGIAMPHPMLPASYKTGIAVAILKNPIEWDKESVRLVFMLNVEEKDYVDLNCFYDKIIKIFNNHTRIQELGTSENVSMLIKKLIK